MADAPELTETQRKILAAALELFSEKGFSGVSTAEIAVKAGVAEKTLFAQFKTKEGLLARTLTPAVFTLLAPDAITGLETTLDAPWESLEAFLVAFLKNRLALAKKHPKTVRLVAHSLLLRPALVGTMRDVFRAHVAPRMAPMLERLAAKGELRDLPPATVVRTLISVTVGFALSRYILKFESAGDDGAEIERVVDLLVYGLKPRSEPAT